MNTIGIIDNLFDIDAMRNRVSKPSAAEVMQAAGGNTGNIAFVFGARQIVGNKVERIQWGQSVQERKIDQLLLCCANQLGAHADLGSWADRLEKYGVPVVLLGLGAQSESFAKMPTIPDGTRRFLSVVTALRPDSTVSNIGVRGKFTSEVLNELGVESVVTGCPSLMISDTPCLGEAILEYQTKQVAPRVAVAAGNPWHGPSSFLEKVLVDVVEQYDGAYVLQHPESLFRLLYGETAEMRPSELALFLKVYGTRFDAQTLQEWFRRNAWDFLDVPNWVRFLRRFDAVIGPRYHGVALGVQAGIPGCVFTIDSRTEELCEETGVKAISVKALAGIDAAGLVESSKWTGEDASRFDALRSAKARVISDFLEANKISPSGHLKQLVMATQTQ